ncbi:hypothetical protein BDB01DRAFT_805547 [Pilobolus umbonatus]|nr:hypothetical protein BDB01DRAFT_805547 [Pilobolus umbonatus]
MSFSEVIIDNRSTLSASAIPQSDKVPDFTEFRLEAFNLNSSPDISPPPHRIREARRSLVLYLEPMEGTPIQTSLKAFQEQSFLKFGPNQAHSNTPHISIIGNILIERGAEFSTKWKVVDEFIQVVDEEIKRHSLIAPEFSGFEVVDKPTRSLVMKARLNSDYEKLARKIEQRLKPRCASLEVRPMDRIHLAYNLMKTIPRPLIKQIREFAESTIDIYDWVKTGGSWKIALYEVMVESHVMGGQHQMTELKSWPIHSQPSTGFTASLPVSIRVKLSYLASWFKSSPIAFTKKLYSQPNSAMKKNAEAMRKSRGLLTV